MDQHWKIGPRSRQIGRHSSPLWLLTLAFLLSVSSSDGLSGQSGTVDLRDITVTPLDGRATITFLLSGSAGTVVIEKKGINHAQVRMKSLRATEKALNSPLPKPGLESIKAHVERTDVLVANARFKREVLDIAVLKREGGKVVVSVQLGRQLTPADLVEYHISSVVIDAGHGGNDPGATGLNGEKEKEITLKVAKMVQEEIRATMPGVRVIMTRTDDRFVELYRRGEIANGAKGDLFVSIHCNATEKTPTDARGFECWVWRPQPKEDVPEGTTPQRRIPANDPPGTEKSRALATNLSSALRGTGLKDRGIHQAGFYVLVGTIMPAVLVELGYLTNEKDLAFLTSSTGQKKVARALVAGIREYASKKRR